MERCKKRVYFYRGLTNYQCKKNAVKDGFCKIHHPDEEKKREMHREKKHVATPFYLINNRHKKI